jgi:uncharacterized protein
MDLGLTVIPRASFAALHWKNGGGMTYEAIRVPPKGDPFSWRVSLAKIDSSGPFSDFRGYDRHMVLLQGRGIALKFDDGAHRELRKVGDWLQFDGGIPVHCTLLDGPCMDLNLMVSKSTRAQARLELLSRNLQVEAGHGQITLIFSLEDALSIDADDGETVRLEPWDLALLSQGSARLNRIAPDKTPGGAVFIATITR